MCASRYPDSKFTDSPHQPPNLLVLVQLRILLHKLLDYDKVRVVAPVLEELVLSTPSAAEGILARLQVAINVGSRREDALRGILTYHTGVVRGFPRPLDIYINDLLGWLERLESGCGLIFGPLLHDLVLYSPIRALTLIDSVDKALCFGEKLHTAAHDVIDDVCMCVHGLQPTRPLDTLLDTLFHVLNHIHRDLVYIVSPILLARVFGGSQTEAQHLVQKAIELLVSIGGVGEDLILHNVSIYSTARRLGLRPKELHDPSLIALLCELFQRCRPLGDDFIDVVLPTLVLKVFTSPDVKASDAVKAVIVGLDLHRDLDADELVGAIVALLNEVDPDDVRRYPYFFNDILATAREKLHLLHPDFPLVIMPIIMEGMLNGREVTTVVGSKRILSRRKRMKGLDNTSSYLAAIHVITVFTPAGGLIQAVSDFLDRRSKGAFDSDGTAGAIIVHLLRAENNLMRYHARKSPSAFDVFAELTASHYKQEFFSVFRNHYVRPPISLLQPVYTLQENCFNRGAPKTTALHKSLVAYIHDLSGWVRREDSRFRDCALYGIGSYYSGLRTSTIPNEQDWFLSIRALDLGEGPERDMWAERVEEDGKVGWQVYVREEGPSWQVWSAIDGPVGCLVFPVENRPGVHQITGLMLVHIYRLLNRAVSLVPLPRGLLHGGMLAPHFHKVVAAGPASTILLLDPECREPIDVDVTFGMEVPLAAASAEAQEVMASLVKKCGLPPTAPLTLHLVPTRDPKWRWVLSSAVLEARLFAHMGPRSPHVQAVRDLKLLVGKFLSWGPLKGAVTEVTEALSAWGAGSGGVGLRTPWVDTTGVAEAVAESLRNEKIPDVTIINKPRGQDGVEVDFLWSYRIWLIVAAVYRHHTGFGAGVVQTPDRDRDRDSHGYHPESCQLCASIAETTGQMELPYNLHPAVAQALRFPVRPWLSLNSAYLKYMVLRDMVQRDKLGLDLLLQPDEEQREQMLKGYLTVLSQTQEQVTILHPLLGTSQVSMVTRNRFIPLEAMWREYSSLLHFLESVVLEDF